METVYLLLPIIGAFVFLFLGCCFGRKMKEMLHIPKQVVLGRAVMQQFPGVRVQQDSDSEDECPAIRIKFRDQRGRQLTGFIPSSASKDSVVPSSCSDSGVALLSASRQSIPPGTSVSGLLKRRYNDVDNTSSPSRLSLDSAIHTSQTYNFTGVDSEDDELHNIIDNSDITPRRVTGLLMKNSQDILSQSNVVYGPPNWDHVVILESLPNNITPDASSLTMVTDSQTQHSLQNVQMLYDSGLMIRHNPLSVIPQTQSLREVRFSSNFEDSKTDLLPCHSPDAKRLSVSLCSINDANFKYLDGLTKNSCHNTSDVNDAHRGSFDDSVCDSKENDRRASVSGSTPSISQKVIEESDATSSLKGNDLHETGTATDSMTRQDIHSNVDDCFNGNRNTVEMPVVFPLLNGIAALVDNMKESQSATLRKVSGSTNELINNNCCFEMEPISDQSQLNTNVHCV